ncbi:hypothetical protein TNCV_1426391 [Trichonephila clavipes]|nr:hypothetical protein TNCV_1426391 [Trichonephila clavipes]
MNHTRSTCSLNQWVRSLVGLITSAGTGEYFPPLQFTCRNCGGGDRGRVAIYRPFGELRRAKIVLSPVWCSRPTTGVPLAHATMNFVGLDLTTSDRCGWIDCLLMSQFSKQLEGCWRLSSNSHPWPSDLGDHLNWYAPLLASTIRPREDFEPQKI